MTHYIPTLLYNFLITHVFTLSFYRSPPFNADCIEASISLHKPTSGTLISLHLWNHQQMLAVIQMSNPCTFVQDPSMTKSDCGLHWSSLVNSLMCTHILILIWFLQRLNPTSLEAVPWFTIKSPRNKKNLCFDLYTQKPDLIEKENLSRDIFLSRLEKKSMFYRITLMFAN